MKVPLKKYVMFYTLFVMSLFSSALYASEKTWTLADVSEDIIENAANKDSLVNVVNFFQGKKIILKNDILHVGDMSCEVINRKVTPMEYWKSERTISFYRDFFKKYSITIPKELNYISFVNPDSQCQKPFSEFIEMNGDLVLFYKNRVVWYYPENDKRLIDNKTDVDRSGNDIPTIWRQHYISEVISQGGEEVTIEKIDEQFKGRTVSIDDKMVNITGACRYEYAKHTMSPIKYWHSEKTVALYRQRLAENNIQLGGKVSLIRPVDPYSDCPYPFSYFIQIDDELIFIVNNRMVIYSHNIKVPDVNTGPICTRKEQTPDQVFEEGSRDDCIYPKMNMADTYKAWRLTLSENKAQILEGLPPKNIKITCKEVCISVIYTWLKANKLKIVEQFAGGDTHTYFNQTSTGTQVTTIYFPD